MEVTTVAATSATGHTWQDVIMLSIVAVTLAAVFLVGLALLVAASGAKYASSDIVAVLSPALTALGTLAAGVFGYSLGTRGTTAAQESAAAARQEAATITRAAAPLHNNVERIITQARTGGIAPGIADHYAISSDDLNTLAADAGNLSPLI
jgi:hypothetical protein